MNSGGKKARIIVLTCEEHSTVGMYVCMDWVGALTWWVRELLLRSDGSWFDSKSQQVQFNCTSGAACLALVLPV